MRSRSIEQRRQRGDGKREAQVLLRRAFAHQLGAFLDQLLEVGRLEAQFEFAGLRLRNIQYVVDQRQQMPPASPMSWAYSR